MSDYGEAGAERLSQMRSALGRRYRDPSVPGREERTRSDILRETGTIPSDVTAPADQDMWEEAEPVAGGESETTTKVVLPKPTEVVYLIHAMASNTRRPDKYPDNWNQGPSVSTRVSAYQFIPIYSDGDITTGDLIVVFISHKKSGARPIYYTYSNRTFNDFNLLKISGSVGRTIGQGSGHERGPSGITGNGDYVRGTKSEEYYRSLHPDFKGELLTDE